MPALARTQGLWQLSGLLARAHLDLAQAIPMRLHPASRNASREAPFAVRSLVALGFVARRAQLKRQLADVPLQLHQQLLPGAWGERGRAECSDADG